MVSSVKTTCPQRFQYIVETQGIDDDDDDDNFDESFLAFSLTLYPSQRPNGSIHAELAPKFSL